MTKIYTSNPPAAKLDTVKETCLMRRKSANKDVINKQVQKALNVRIQARKRSSMFKGAEAFIKEAKQSTYDKKRIMNISKNKSPLCVLDSPKLGIIIRLGGFKGLCEKTLNIFKSLRLDTINQAVFVKIDQKMMKKLSIINPYIAWGYPSTEIVNDLLAKRCWAKIDDKRVRITNNVIVERHLGKYNILCVPDIAHELINVGKNFDVVNEFLWPFKLISPPPGWLGLGHKRKHNLLEPCHRDVFINDLCRRMI